MPEYRYIDIPYSLGRDIMQHRAPNKELLMNDIIEANDLEGWVFKSMYSIPLKRGLSIINLLLRRQNFKYKYVMSFYKE